MAEEEKTVTFWDHLDELRKVLFHITIGVVIFMIIAFLNKEILFDIVLAPHRSDFVIYRLFCLLAEKFSMPALCPEAFHVNLINTQLASQFLIHMSTSFYAGILLSSPYILYQLFRFVSPALYENEKKYSFRVIVSSFVLFAIGVLLNYFFIFPLSFRFLATYQVSAEVENIISITSYIDTLMMLSLMMGIMSELPILAWLFAKLGFITSDFMKKYRRHAIVIILAIAAVITPTADVFTLLLVSTPIYLLYELSILVVVRTNKRQKRVEKEDAEEEWENPYKY